MKQALLAIAVALFAIGAEAQTKKLLRIHTAGPNDTNVDNTKLAVEFRTAPTPRRVRSKCACFPPASLARPAR